MLTNLAIDRMPHIVGVNPILMGFNWILMGLIGFSSMVMTIYWDILYSPFAVCALGFLLVFHMMFFLFIQFSNVLKIPKSQDMPKRSQDLGISSGIKS
jgi:hypothetical protein